MSKLKVGQPETNPLLKKLWAQQVAHASPEQRADLVGRHVISPEGVYLHQPHRSGLSDLGHVVGSVLKVAAPLAGFIPGIGIPLGAALAAGGSAAGGALHGDKFNLGKTLLAGAAGAGGAALSGAGGAASAGTAAGQTAVPSGLGGAANTAAFANAAPLAAGSAAASSAPGILGKIGGFVSGNPGKAARLGFGALGAIQGSQQQGKADDLIKRSLAPLNQPNPYADLNVGSYGNPYAQPAQMSGRASLRRELMR